MLSVINGKFVSIENKIIYNMSKFSEYKRLRILSLYREGYKSPKIKELKQLLKKNDYSLGSTSIAKCRRELGWSYRGSAYCQLIRDHNKIKRLQWTASQTVFILTRPLFN